jgi:hypothetical protein
MTVEEFETFLARDIPRWEKMIRDLGLAAR